MHVAAAKLARSTKANLPLSLFLSLSPSLYPRRRAIALIKQRLRGLLEQFLLVRQALLMCDSIMLALNLSRSLKKLKIHLDLLVFQADRSLKPRKLRYADPPFRERKCLLKGEIFCRREDGLISNYQSIIGSRRVAFFSASCVIKIANRIARSQKFPSSPLPTLAIV